MLPKGSSNWNPKLSSSHCSSLVRLCPWSPGRECHPPGKPRALGKGTVSLPHFITQGPSSPCTPSVWIYKAAKGTAGQAHCCSCPRSQTGLWWGARLSCSWALEELVVPDRKDRNPSCCDHRITSLSSLLLNLRITALNLEGVLTAGGRTACETSPALDRK